MRPLAPHWGALLALSLFLVVGLAVLNDYGVTYDESPQRTIAATNIGYLRGWNDAFASEPFWIRLYGIAFEAPLFIADRAFGLDDTRGIMLFRHLITHLAFLSGGLFAYLLAHRLFNNKSLALLAMLIFLLHPRLYAHSFFNTKDIPFLVMFIVALYLTHRAFKRDTLPAYVLLGVGVGVLVNIRVMGIILAAGIPSLRALDFIVAQGWDARKRILVSIAAFGLPVGLAFFALLPYLWADPVGRIVEWWSALSDHSFVPNELFRGMLYWSVNFPIEYLPVWFSITSPPFALALGLAGSVAVLAGRSRARRGALGSARLRFGLFLLGCFALPVLAVSLSNSNLYNGWRQMYFLWAPFALLAVYGLERLLSALRRPRLRAAVYGAAGAGLAATLISMALIHPNQQVYFNFSVDRVAPERLRMQYEMGYWTHPALQALQWLADNPHALPDNPSVPPHFIQRTTAENIEMLPDAARARIEKNISVDIVQTIMRNAWSRSDRALRRVRVYENTIIAIEPKPDLQAVYEATLGRVPDVDSAFDVHLLDGAVALVMEPCLPSFITQSNVKVRAAPVNRADLPPHREGETDEVRFFELYQHGEFFNGKCVASLPLPGYPVADVVLDWGAPPLDHAVARDAMRRARTDGRLLARAAYDVYITNDELVYVKEPCSPNAAKTLFFFVHIYPRSEDDLPEDQRRERPERRYVKRNHHGALLPDACVALFPLPDYPVAGFQTGQRGEDGLLWDASFSANPDGEIAWSEWSPPLPDEGDAPDAMRRAKEEGRLLASSFYDVYLADGELVYIQENCDPLQTEHSFFLDIYPRRVTDLPEDRRARGFERSWFAFHRQRGVFVGDACVVLFSLPDYPVAGFRTGQRDGGNGNLWRASFSANPEPYRAVHRAAASSEPVARSVFDIHVSDNALVYVKEPCEQADTEARFFLHVVPERESDLPEDRRAYGFNGLDFDFFLNGAWIDGKCAARIALPDYPVASIRTGQHISGEREIWRAEFAVGR